MRGQQHYIASEGQRYFGFSILDFGLKYGEAGHFNPKSAI
jgi:hypothetical protein